MKFSRFLIPLGGFAAGMAVAIAWPGSPGSGLSGTAAASRSEQVADRRAGSDSGDPAGPGDAGPERKIKGKLPDFPATGPPTMEEVLNATGLDRMLMMARFIETATPADLSAMMDRIENDQIYEPTFADQVWLRWVEIDLSGALARGNSSAAWWAWTKLDPEAALQSALTDHPGKLAAVIHSIGQGDPALGQKLLLDHPEIDRRFAVMGVLDGLEKRDPAAATAMAMDLGNDAFKPRFENWMRLDRDQALAWMRGQSDPVQRGRLEDLALGMLIQSDPAAGLAEARQLPLGERQLKSSVEAIAALALEDPEAAQAAAEAIPSPYGREKALLAVAGSLASSDPEAAVAMLPLFDRAGSGAPNDWSYSSAEGTFISSGSSGDSEKEALLDKLMTNAPEATAEALLARPVPDRSALSSAMQRWAGLQPEAASAWLNGQPGGPAKDAGIDGLTHWLTSGSPEPDFPAALAWAAAASPEHQISFYQRSLQQWKQQDPQAAADAVATLPVTDAQRSQLLDMIK